MPSIIIDSSGDLHAGQMLGRYELLMPIAKGGMGNVWAARLKGTRGFRKLVAIKTILRTLENPQLEQMLFQEATLASQIHHPNVAETFELGEHEGTLYLVMELVTGESLLFMLRQAQPQGGVPIAVSVNLVGQVCRGLAAAHDLRDETGQLIGLVHRDISPPNVLVTDTGTVKIVDFGVATTASSATCGSGEIKGKISYLAPEQLRGEALDARVDVFATGILLYLLTVGRHPFRGASEAATIARILSEVPAAPPSSLVEDYPEGLEQVVMRAVAKDRDARYATITELLEALEDAYPSAFGPRADEQVTSYVQELMKERLQERRSMLRVAEEWAETSSARLSVTSLPAVAASRPAPKPTSHAAWFGVGGVILGLTLAAATVLYLRLPTDTLATASSNPARAGLSDERSAVAASSPPVQVQDLPQMSAPEETDATAPAETSTQQPSEQQPSEQQPSEQQPSEQQPSEQQPSEQQPSEQGHAALSARERSKGSSATSEEREAATDAASTPASVPASDPPPEPAGLAADLPAMRVATLSLPALPAPTPAPVVVPTPAKPASTAPRTLASKVGHRQLITDPRSQAVRLPPALKQSGQTFSASLSICVDASGKVSSISISRSAGPALDPQIVELLSRWKYRPLLEGGRATPFCYPMKYQVEPE